MAGLFGGVSRNPLADGFMARRSSLQVRLDQIAGFAVVLLLIVGCVLVLRPFFSPLLWAMVLTVSTWPAFQRLSAWLGGRRWLAAAIMTALLAAAFVLPLLLAGTRLADNLESLWTAFRLHFEGGPPSSPAWLDEIPWIGPAIAGRWQELVRSPQDIAALLQPALGPLKDLLVASGLSAGSAVLQVSMSVLSAYFFYRDGEVIAAYLRAAGERVAGEQALQFFTIAETTVRGIVYGTVGTAIVQGALALIGFVIAGVPAAFPLAFATFILALFPVGAPLVWIPTAIWLYYAQGIGWAVFMVAWGLLVVGGADNIVRPYLISRGSRLPFLIAFMGIIGGAAAFGFLGIFLGPTLLAVGLAVVRAWSLGEEEAVPAPGLADASGRSGVSPEGR